MRSNSRLARVRHGGRRSLNTFVHEAKEAPDLDDGHPQGGGAYHLITCTITAGPKNKLGIATLANTDWLVSGRQVPWETHAASARFQIFRQ